MEEKVPKRDVFEGVRRRKASGGKGRKDNLIEKGNLNGLTREALYVGQVKIQDRHTRKTRAVGNFMKVKVEDEPRSKNGPEKL